ncbi:MAG: TSUP family transporter [Hyphomicrobiales bacterium]|nr:TSUP family transporter [Hyphomicrobiales bacterium]
MLTPLTLILAGISVLATSFLSGVVGMAGGMILMGILLLLMDVTAAMVLHGVTQTASNGWRALLWRAHINWRIILGYAVGSFAMFLLMKAMAHVPDKSLVYIAMGLTPFLVELVPAGWRPDVMRRGGSVLCGAVVMLVQLMAGVAGNVLDIFFQKSNLDRKTIVATKAASQTMAHVQRVAFFGSLSDAGDIFPLWIYGGSIALAMTGASLAALVLARISEASFRSWSRTIILAVSAVYLAKGVWLLLQP